MHQNWFLQVFLFSQHQLLRDRNETVTGYTRAANMGHGSDVAAKASSWRELDLLVWFMPFSNTNAVRRSVVRLICLWFWNAAQTLSLIYARWCTYQTRTIDHRWLGFVLDLFTLFLYLSNASYGSECAIECLSVMGCMIASTEYGNRRADTSSFLRNGVLMGVLMRSNDWH